MKRLAIAIAVVLITTVAAGAQPKPIDAANEAKAKAGSAKAAFDRGDYAVAVEEYREAYRLMPSPGLLYNLGQAYRLVGSCGEAAEAYREYLRLVPDSPYRETAQQNLAAADVCARDAEAAAKRREERKREAALAAATAAATPPPPPDDRGRGMRRAGVGAMAVGGMLVVAGGYFAIDASYQEQEVSDFYEQGGAWDEVADADARGKRSQLISRVTFATGGVALAAGVTLYVLGRRGERTPVVTAAPAGGGAKMVVSWRF
jgi:tetratricopeptide (TPR) repeat protein